MKSREKLQEQFHVRLTLDGKTIFAGFFKNEEDPEGNVETAKMVDKQIRAIFHEHPETIFNLLVDLVAADNALKMVPHESRKIYSGLLNHKQLNKVAALGSNSFLSGFIEVMAMFTGKGKKVRWFTNVDEAKNWLDE